MTESHQLRGIALNLLVANEDGKLVWTTSPVSVEDLLPASRDECLQIQSKPTTSELFSSKPNSSTVRIYAHSAMLFPSKGPSRIRPSIITVERASLCQIFLETKYHRTFAEPTDRETRRQTLLNLLSKGKRLSPEEEERMSTIVREVECEWSRLSRVRPSLQSFEMIRKLGSGGFGTVNLVREHQTGKLFALKVLSSSRLTESISKDKTLRLGHEGRALCERDLLKKAIESGTNWICKLHYAFQDTQALYTPEMC
jgi:hypothetical protein